MIYFQSLHKISIVQILGTDHTIKIFDFTGKLMRKIENCHSGKRITCLIASDDAVYESAIIVTGGEDQIVRIWGVKSAKMRFELKGHSAHIGLLFAYIFIYLIYV